MQTKLPRAMSQIQKKNDFKTEGIAKELAVYWDIKFYLKRKRKQSKKEFKDIVSCFIFQRVLR